MNDRENDNRIKDEGRQVQQELEDQLRAFGDTMTDAFAATALRAGAWRSGTGLTMWARPLSMRPTTASGRQAKAFRKSWAEAWQNRAKQTTTEGYADADTSGMPGWFRQIFAKPEPTPVESIRISAKKRYSDGLHSAGRGYHLCGDLRAGRRWAASSALGHYFCPALLQRL